jgi:hypothetical protein
MVKAATYHNIYSDLSEIVDWFLVRGICTFCVGTIKIMKGGESINNYCIFACTIKNKNI